MQACKQARQRCHRLPPCLFGVRHLLWQAQALGALVWIVGPPSRGVVDAAMEPNELQAAGQADMGRPGQQR